MPRSRRTRSPCRRSRRAPARDTIVVSWIESLRREARAPRPAGCSASSVIRKRRTSCDPTEDAEASAAVGGGDRRSRRRCCARRGGQEHESGEEDRAVADHSARVSHAEETRSRSSSVARPTRHIEGVCSGSRYFSGSSLNSSRQPLPQNQYVVPSCSKDSSGGGRVDLHPAHGIDLDGHRRSSRVLPRSIRARTGLPSPGGTVGRWRPIDRRDSAQRARGRARASARRARRGDPGAGPDDVRVAGRGRQPGLRTATRPGPARPRGAAPGARRCGARPAGRRVRSGHA